MRIGPDEIDIELPRAIVGGLKAGPAEELLHRVAHDYASLHEENKRLAVVEQRQREAAEATETIRQLKRDLAVSAQVGETVEELQRELAQAAHTAELIQQLQCEAAQSAETIRAARAARGRAREPAPGRSSGPETGRPAPAGTGSEARAPRAN